MFNFGAESALWKFNEAGKKQLKRVSLFAMEHTINLPVRGLSSCYYRRSTLGP